MDAEVKRKVADDQDVFMELPRLLNQVAPVGPRLDAHEADGTVELTAEVPGVPESGIEISLDGKILTIRVDKEDRNEGKRVHFSERWFGQFERSIQLPFEPEPDRVQASVENGVLTISFPRVDADRTRHIEIRGARPEVQEEERPAFGTDWPERERAQEVPLTLDVQATRLR